MSDTELVVSARERIEDDLSQVIESVGEEMSVRMFNAICEFVLESRLLNGADGL